MYTQCPHCQTIFGVSEAHLSAAFGRVRCGHCRGQFNAKRHLLESIPEQKITPAIPPSPPAIAEQTIAAAATETLAEHSGLPDAILDDEIGYIDLSPPSEAAATETNQTDAAPSHEQPAADIKPSIPAKKSDNEELDAIFAALDHRLEELSEDTPDTVLKPYEKFNSGDIRPDSIQDAFGDPDSQTEDDIKNSIESIFAAAEAELNKTATPDAEVPAPDESPLAEFLADIDVELMGTTEADQLVEDIESADPLREDVFTSRADENIEDFEPATDPAEDSHQLYDDSDTATGGQQAGTPVFEQEELPFVLHEALSGEPAPPHSWPKTMGLVGLIIVLLAAIGFQLALFRNVELANKLPELQPYLQRFCQYLPCQFTGQRDVKRIHLTSRDVRARPEGKNTIVISAIFVNNARFDQPYPDILITLSDLTTTVVAQRRFTPQDYLANSNPFQLMKAGKPVQITLEVLDPGNDAVNFQFDFL